MNASTFRIVFSINRFPRTVADRRAVPRQTLHSNGYLLRVFIPIGPSHPKHLSTLKTLRRRICGVIGLGFGFSGSRRLGLSKIQSAQRIPLLNVVWKVGFSLLPHIVHFSLSGRASDRDACVDFCDRIFMAKSPNFAVLGLGRVPKVSTSAPFLLLIECCFVYISLMPVSIGHATRGISIPLKMICCFA